MTTMGEVDPIELILGSNMALAERLTAHLPHGQALGCTGLAAAWCPLHGDCTCDRGDHLEQQDDCPLHGGADDPFTVLQIGLVTTPEGQCQYPGCEQRSGWRYKGSINICTTHASYFGIDK